MRRAPFTLKTVRCAAMPILPFYFLLFDAPPDEWFLLIQAAERQSWKSVRLTNR